MFIKNTLLKPTLLWVSHSSRADGGAELSLSSLISSAKKRGYKQHVVIPSSGDLEKILTRIGVGFSVIPYTWWTIGSTKTPRDLKNNILAADKLSGFIRQTGSNIVITNTMVVPWGALASTKAGVPHVWMIREFGRADQGLRFTLGNRSTYKFIDRFSSLIIANSHAVKNHILSFIKADEKIIVSYPAVNIPNTRRSASNKGKNIIKLLMVGTVRESKGQLDAVKALCMLPPSVTKNIRLTLVGACLNYERQKIKNYIKKSGRASNLVRFTGPQQNPFKFLTESDVYIMASKNEAFGRVTVEAMMARLPVIGSRSGGTIEIVVDGSSGILYEPGNLESLSKAILKLATNAELRAKMGINSHKIARTLFNKDKSSESFFTNLDSLSQMPYQSTSKLKLDLNLLSIIALLTITSLLRIPYRFIKTLAKH